MSSLQEVFVSRASARQRAGRAGRVRPGHCWRLYSKEFLESPCVDENPAPEIQRVPLEEVVLQVLLLKLGLPDHFLSQCLEPPSMNQIKTSVTCLLEIKAILPKSNLPLTALGYHLAQMPVDVRIGKMLITASLLNCIEPALTVAATLAGKSPFTTPPSNREEASKAHNCFTSSYNYALTAEKYSIIIPTHQKVKSSDNGKYKEDLTPPNDVFFSDHLACVNAYNLWEKIFHQRGIDAAYTFCREKYLSNSCLNEIMKLRESFKSHLRNAGFLPSLTENGCEDDTEIEIENGFSTMDSLGTKMENIFNITSSNNSTTLSSNNDNGYGIMRCALCAGLSTQVVRVSRFEDQAQKSQRKSASSRGGQAPLHIMQGDGVEVHVHPSSLTHNYVKYLLEGGQGSGQGQSQRSKDAYIVYHKKVASTKVYLHDCTVVPSTAILLFGGDILISRTRKGSNHEVGVLVTVGSWIHFKMNELHAVLFRRLQGEIESLLRIKVEDPTSDVTKRQAVLVKVIETLLE